MSGKNVWWEKCLIFELCGKNVCWWFDDSIESDFSNFSNSILNRSGFEGVFMGVCSSVDVTQSEGDLPDFNQSEH